MPKLLSSFAVDQFVYFDIPKNTSILCIISFIVFFNRALTVFDIFIKILNLLTLIEFQIKYFY